MVLIFDMDGVLVDNHQWHFKAWSEFGKRHGLNISRKEFGSHFGSTNQMIMTSLFGDHLTKEEHVALANEKETIYREIYRTEIKAVTGLPGFLQYAKQKGIQIALATSAPSANVSFTLEETGLRKYFDVITDASMVTTGKPDPEIYLLTAKRMNVRPVDCIVFEDSVAGIMSAQKAGIFVVGVATTHEAAELSKYVNTIIQNFETADNSLDHWFDLAQKQSIIS